MLCLIKLFQKPTPFGSVWCIVFTKTHVTWNSNRYSTYVSVREKKGDNSGKFATRWVKKQYIFYETFIECRITNNFPCKLTYFGEKWLNIISNIQVQRTVYTSIINLHVSVPWIPWMSLFSNLLSSFRGATFFFCNIYFLNPHTILFQQCILFIY